MSNNLDLDKLVCRNKDALLMNVDDLIYEDHYIDEDVISEEVEDYIAGCDEEIGDNVIVESIDFAEPDAPNFEMAEMDDIIQESVVDNPIRAPEEQTVNLEGYTQELDLAPKDLVDDLIFGEFIIDEEPELTMVPPSNALSDEEKTELAPNDDIILDATQPKKVEAHKNVTLDANSLSDVAVDNVELHHIIDEDPLLAEDTKEKIIPPLEMQVISDGDYVKLELENKELKRRNNDYVDLNATLERQVQNLQEDNLHFKNTIKELKNDEEFVEKNILDKKIPIIYTIFITMGACLLLGVGMFLAQPNYSNIEATNPAVTEQTSFNVAETALANYIALYIAGDIDKETCAFYISQIPFESIFAMSDTIADEELQVLFKQKEEAINVLLYSFEYDDIDKLASVYEDFVRAIEEINKNIGIYFENYLKQNDIEYTKDAYGNLVI